MGALEKFPRHPSVASVRIGLTTGHGSVRLLLTGGDPHVDTCKYAPATPSRKLADNAQKTRAALRPIVCMVRICIGVWTKPRRFAQLGDAPIDELLDELDVRPGDDALDALYVAAAATPQGRAVKFLAEMQAVPSRVDWDLISRGQRVFISHFPAASVVLYNVSLVAGFSIPKVTKVLEQSGYLVGSPAAAMRRLFETGRLLIDCCMEEGAMAPGTGAGWKSALRVRALHGRVRRRLLRRQEPHAGEDTTDGLAWDVATYGVPINQEDMAATLLAFSYNVLIGLEVLRGDRPLPQADQEAYLHLWRYIGFLLGVRDEYNPCARDVPYAKAFLESVIVHLLQPDDLSRTVAHKLLRAPIAANPHGERSSTRGGLCCECPSDAPLGWRRARRCPRAAV